MTPRRGLGRGLDALLGAEQGERGESLQQLAVDRLVPGRYQPRQQFDEAALVELADSIRAQGLVQPVVVRPSSEDRYEIIAGERRWRAAQLAGLHELPCVVRRLDDRAALAVALVENVQRENLTALEEAEALARLRHEFELTHQEVAEAVGRSRVAVTNLLRLLELEAPVRRLLADGALDMGHGRALLGLSGEHQCAAARQAAVRQLSVRQTEALVRRLARGPKPVPPADPDVQQLERRLAALLAAPVELRHRGGKGTITIRYHSLEELDGVLHRLGEKR
ncbi:MAG TPA: ParB/RepB/Spo0J family partition protein [Gammaproteobacteria bacterium]|nr:ParB/RepB/Spo0J family partition protein [Gammaproteobacteria bacterium]